MAQKTVIIPEVGEVTLSKRRGATNMRLSINGAGKIRVGMPLWTPYTAGIAFAKGKKDWIQKQLVSHSSELIKDGDLIGKAHRIYFVISTGKSTVSTKITSSSIRINTDLPVHSSKVQQKALSAAEKALKEEANKLLPQRLRLLATRHGFSYREVKVRKLISRWGSCSQAKVITLSYYLIQLPWPLIDYVLLHELTHTKHMNHSSRFWNEFQEALPDAKKLRKEIKLYKPKVKPSSGFMQI